MHRSARQAAIMKSLSLNGTCAVAELAGKLSVAEETIRRDIKAMASKGLVERVHGGAVLPDLFREADFQRRLDHNATAKKAIARRVAAQVRNGESVMLDTGSTTAYVARALTDHSDLLVVTNCADIARTLASRNRNQVYLAGGEFRADDGAVLGASAIRFIGQFKVRTAILSMAATNPNVGLMDFHLREAEFSQAVMAQARRVIVAADASKFAIQAPVKVCEFAAIDTLVTNRTPPDPAAKQLAKAGVTVLIA
jgi:DeoR family transcriptional regulator, glycerol-3-phosphate regulon repressor